MTTEPYFQDPPSSDLIDEIFSHIPPREWEVWVWPKGQGSITARLDANEQRRLIRTILIALRLPQAVITADRSTNHDDMPSQSEPDLNLKPSQIWEIPPNPTFATLRAREQELIHIKLKQQELDEELQKVKDLQRDLNRTRQVLKGRIEATGQRNRVLGSAATDLKNLIQFVTEYIPPDPAIATLSERYPDLAAYEEEKSDAEEVQPTISSAEARGTQWRAEGTKIYCWNRRNQRVKIGEMKTKYLARLAVQVQNASLR